MIQKLGFWSVFALVTGSQIGTGIFMLPISLAPYGIYSIYGWLLSSLGAISIALVFSMLCAQFPKTGGPHVYVQKAFGSGAAFFTGWTYWVISFVSTSMVVVSAVGYLTPIIGNQNNISSLGLQLLLLITIAVLNLRGIEAAGRTAFILSVAKFIPLLIIATCALCQFNIKNFITDAKVVDLTISEIMGRVTLLTFWGFIGIECATTSAGSVINPSKTIPRAIIFGTICVAILYLLNSLGIMGLIPGGELINSRAPYVDAAQIIFGSKWYILISLIASIICIGTLNSWILISGQITLGLAEDKFLPRFFVKRNNKDAPVWGIIISCIGIVPLLAFTANDDLATQVTQIIDFSVIAFLFVYLICSLAFMKIILTNNQISYIHLAIGVISIIFCSWIIYETSIKVLIVAGMFVLSGAPLYFFWYRKNGKSTY